LGLSFLFETEPIPPSFPLVRLSFFSIAIKSHLNLWNRRDNSLGGNGLATGILFNPMENNLLIADSETSTLMRSFMEVEVEVEVEVKVEVEEEEEEEEEEEDII